MALNIRPLRDQLLVEPIEGESQTSSGIILPETARERPQRGRVLAAGPGRLVEGHKRLPMEVSEGDHVLFARYAGTEVKLEGRDLLVLQEGDVLAVMID